MCPWVILHHQLPDGSSHLDWLIQSDPVNRQAPLISFRVSSRPDDPSVLAFQAERIQEHRPLYLEFEGEVSANRGRVTRLASGLATIQGDNGVFIVTLDGGRTWVGRRADFASPLYSFRLHSGPEARHTD
jgi:hypothetical protein